MELTAHQHDAISSAVDALADHGEYCIKGLAGTGKTTILKELVNRFNENLITVGDAELIHVCAPTNKAASVLKEKGLPSPKTVHNLAYQFQGVKRTVICTACKAKYRVNIFKQSQAVQPCQFCDGGLTELADLNEDEELSFANKDFDSSIVVIDEASMVGLRMANDLRLRCPRILWCGDYGQLPPVKDAESGIFEGPGFTLSEIHRQAAGNPIIDLAYRLREGHKLGSRIEFGNEGVWYSGQRGAGFVAGHSKIDIFITHSNNDRVAINMAKRQRLGFDPNQPQPGDVLSILTNQYRYGIYNGDLAEVVKCVPYKAPKTAKTFGAGSIYDKLDDCWHITIKHPATDAHYTFACPKAQFNNPKRLRSDVMEDIDDKYENVMLADYGYAITGHKSQGSQWPNVGVVVPRYDFSDMERWAYTVATRASENLIIFGADAVSEPALTL